MEAKKSGRIALAETDSGAAFRLDEREDAADGGIVGPIDDLAAVTFLEDQPGLDQRSQMVGKGRWWQAAQPSDVADVQSIPPGAHEKPENPQPGLVPEGGKSRRCLLLVHARHYNQ